MLYTTANFQQIENLQQMQNNESIENQRLQQIPQHNDMLF